MNSSLLLFLFSITSLPFTDGWRNLFVWCWWRCKLLSPHGYLWFIVVVVIVRDNIEPWLLAIKNMWTIIGRFGPAYNPGTSLGQAKTERQTPKKTPWPNVCLLVFTDSFM
jgi:hypothetical protein